jgi:Ca2+-binding RTX toxin-like protein
MPVFSGTNADDNIVGTNEDDIFHTSRGQDILAGLGGYDTLNADFSTAVSAYGNFSVDEFGLKGTLGDSNSNWRTEFYAMEKVAFVSGSGSDGFYLGFDRTIAGYMIAINAGAGFDYLILNLSLGQHAALTGNAATSIGNANFAFSNIEQYFLDLGNGNDDLTMGASNDEVASGPGDDRIFGVQGNDFLEGQAGGDYLDGGDGNDRLYAYEEYIGVDDGAEIDTLKGGAGDDLLSIGYGDSADGGTGTDRLSISLRSGTTGAVLDLSVLFAGGTITIGGGTITGVEAYDKVYGTDYADTIITGDAPNMGPFLASGIFGFGGDDVITTGSRVDTVNGGLGNDTIRGGGDADWLVGDEGNDRIFGDGGNDTIFGAVDDDELHGGDGNDLIYADFGQDQLFGDDGADKLFGGPGADSMSGGAGDDIFYLEGADSLAEAVGGGNDIAYASQTFLIASASYVLTAGAEIETLSAETMSANIAITLTGNAFGQLIIGSGGNNLIDGGGGTDTLRGGAGDDVYIVDDASDLVVELVGGGADRVTVNTDYSLAAGQSVETLGTDNDAGTAPITLRGNEMDNRIVGNAGANALYGGGGDDRIEGGGGNDRIEGGLGTDDLFGGAGADVFAFASGDSRNAIRSDGKKYMPDMIWDFASGEDRIDLSAIDAKFGTAANDAFTFIGTAAFGGHAGELRYEARGAQLLLLGDTDGNGVGDFLLVLTAATLQGADFIL